MSWLYFALAGPVLWAISTHLDKYLVERYFKSSNVAVMLIFTSLAALLLMPFIWWFEPTVIARDAVAIGLIMMSGLLYIGALFFYLKALPSARKWGARRALLVLNNLFSLYLETGQYGKAEKLPLAEELKLAPSGIDVTQARANLASLAP